MKSQVRHLDAMTIIIRLLLAAGAVALFVAAVASAQPSRPADSRGENDVERLQATGARLDADAARAASAPEGQRRVAERLAEQFKVDESLVTNLRTRKLGWGEVAITLALSQELMKQDASLTQAAAIQTILDKRQGGAGWGGIAHELDLKLGHVISEVRRADKGVERIARHERPEKLAKQEKPEKAEKAERPEKPERVQRAERPEKPERGR
jgi:hypothetical protein